MSCHRLILPGRLGRRICTHSTLAVRTQVTSGANFVITISEGSALASQGYPDRNRAVCKDKCLRADAALLTDNTRMTMHKKKSKTLSDRFPSPYLGSGSFLRIPHFYDFLSFSFNLLSFHFSYEGRMEFWEPIVRSGLFLGGVLN